MVQRYNPDYVMHAARFAPFARENEHGEFVKFSDYEALVSELATSQQINTQTLQVKLTMAETIKELTDRVNALAVENAALKDGFEWLYAVVSSDEVSIPDEKYSAVTNAAAVLSETPATDTALAAIQAQGVEKFADDLHKTAMAMCSVKPENTTPGAYAGMARSFAKKLREAK
ncbi:hypothetical protein [uncultured Serratia sp.]|uniref:hypothetical protein n=1 Tax=uncultured Serratia sp. TaxID=239175 RepID=UPI00258F4312|nr:hypothetical protein [uncultured Serratia sp.]